MYNTEIGIDINKAIALLNANELVAIPTETVYGLASNALSTEAVMKIFEAKSRPFFNPLILHLAAVEQIEQYAFIDKVSLLLNKIRILQLGFCVLRLDSLAQRMVES